MFLKFQLILLSLTFAVILELGTLNDNFFFQALFALIVFSILVIWPLAKKIRFLAVPFFLSIGSLNLLFLIDSPLEKHVFIALSAITYYLAILGAYRLKMYDCDQTAQGMINLATLATGFFWFVSNYGWYLNFQIGIWVLVATFIGSSFLLALPSLMICNAACCNLEGRKKGFSEEKMDELREDRKGKMLFLIFILSLIMGEVILVLSFWPFNYLTTGVVALIIYFAIWDTIRLYSLRLLSRKIIIADFVFALISILAVLSTAQWNLVV